MKSEKLNKPPVVIITGASGFIGRHIVDDLSSDHRIFAIARRSPQECKAPVHSNIAWIRSDISNWNSISKAFREIQSTGNVDYLIHLAAYYDFTGENNPEYKRTNIEGTKNILKLVKGLNLKCFIFASSVAACSYPKENEYVDENSEPDGTHIYSHTKKIGENLVNEYLDEIPSCIVRFGAVYSDWCEYPPLYALLNTWLTGNWKSRFVAGKGNTSLPFIHIRDIVSFFRQLLKNIEKVKNGKILLASTEGSTNHKILFRLSTTSFFGKSKTPILIPKLLTGFGIYIMNLFRQTFEKPWMWKYIDKSLNIKNKITQDILSWKPNSRLLIEQRIPFLIERYKSEPYTWQNRNIAILKKSTYRPSYSIYTALSDKEDVIIQQVLDRIHNSVWFTKQPPENMPDESELVWQIKLIYKLLITSIHTNNKLLIQNYFEVSGFNRFKAGYTGQKLNFILNAINHIAWMETSRDDTLESFKKEIYDYITMPINFAIDEVELQYQQYLNYQKEGKKPPDVPNHQNIQRTAKNLLEETIWKCLVYRK